MVTTPAVSVVPVRPLSAVLESVGAILVYHPAYSRPTILLRLEVYPIRGSHVPGVPLALVLDACQIIANNARGYLTLYGDHTEIAIRSDTLGDLLRPGKYHYRVPSHTDGPYPICLKFRAWEPPVAAPRNCITKCAKSGKGPRDLGKRCQGLDATCKDLASGW
ncbi:hypothetical protein K438DRAFT_2009838 [Mycena galopus ATCC 62051]|nr:hypothetical protein K438DRAFT_2009838 [Mycena galopus ATCC 62051]